MRTLSITVLLLAAVGAGVFFWVRGGRTQGQPAVEATNGASSEAPRPPQVLEHVPGETLREPTTTSNPSDSSPRSTSSSAPSLPQWEAELRDLDLGQRKALLNKLRPTLAERVENAFDSIVADGRALTIVGDLEETPEAVIARVLPPGSLGFARRTETNKANRTAVFLVAAVETSDDEEFQRLLSQIRWLETDVAAPRH